MVTKILNIKDGCEIFIEDMKISVKCNNNELSKDFSSPLFRDIKLSVDDNNFVVKSDSERKMSKAMVGTIIAHARNMMIGVKNGYIYKLKIHNSHFPMAVEIKDDKVMIKNFLGEKGYRIAQIFGDAEVKAGKDEVIVSGSDKEHVGQTAINIERACSIKGRDRRIVNDGIYIDDRSIKGADNE